MMGNIEIRAIELANILSTNGEKQYSWQLQWRYEPKSIRSVDTWKTVPVKTTTSARDYKRWINGSDD